jgi:phage repressor protein C with HTH and peptisase S24 domain
MTENQRLKILINELNFKNQADFAKSLNITAGGLSDVIRSKNGIGVSDKIKRQLEIIHSVNIKWLETGEGEMLNNKKSNPRLEAIPLHISADPSDHDNDGSRFEEQPDGTLRMRIPVVPHKAFAGYLRGFKDPDYYEDLEYISIDVFKQHRGHYLAFEVKGDSMTTLEPGLFRRSIFDGVKVVGRELQRHHWQYKLHTNNYDAWIIVHKTEGILIKQIINHDVEKGIITIHSLNPDKKQYADENLRLDDIEQIFNVVKKIDE